MSLTKQMIDNLSRDLSPVAPEYGEWCDGAQPDDRPDEDEWPSKREMEDDYATR